MKTAILDTSILIKLQGKKVGATMEQIISTQLAGFELYISEVSCYEFLRSVRDKNDLDSRMQFLKRWNRLTIDTSTSQNCNVLF